MECETFELNRIRKYSFDCYMYVWRKAGKSEFRSINASSMILIFNGFFLGGREITVTSTHSVNYGEFYLKWMNELEMRWLPTNPEIPPVSFILQWNTCLYLNIHPPICLQRLWKWEFGWISATQNSLTFLENKHIFALNRISIEKYFPSKLIFYIFFSNTYVKIIFGSVLLVNCPIDSRNGIVNSTNPQQIKWKWYFR